MTKLQAFQELMNGGCTEIVHSKDRYNLSLVGEVLTQRGKGFILKDMDEENWSIIKSVDWTEKIENGLLCIFNGSVVLVVSCMADGDTVKLSTGNFETIINPETGEIQITPAEHEDVKEFLWTAEKAEKVEVTEFDHRRIEPTEEPIKEVAKEPIKEPTEEPIKEAADASGKLKSAQPKSRENTVLPKEEAGDVPSKEPTLFERKIALLQNFSPTLVGSELEEFLDLYEITENDFESYFSRADSFIRLEVDQFVKESEAMNQ